MVRRVLLRYPIKSSYLTRILDFIDRGHSLCSLCPPAGGRLPPLRILTRVHTGSFPQSLHRGVGFTQAFPQVSHKPKYIITYFNYYYNYYYYYDYNYNYNYNFNLIFIFFFFFFLLQQVVVRVSWESGRIYWGFKRLGWGIFYQKGEVFCGKGGKKNQLRCDCCGRLESPIKKECHCEKR